MENIVSPALPEDNTKPFWASQTIWSAIAVVGASLTGAVLAWKSSDMASFGACLTAAFGGGKRHYRPLPRHDAYQVSSHVENLPVHGAVGYTRRNGFGWNSSLSRFGRNYIQPWLCRRCGRPYGETQLTIGSGANCFGGRGCRCQSSCEPA